MAKGISYDLLFSRSAPATDGQRDFERVNEARFYSLVGSQPTDTLRLLRRLLQLLLLLLAATHGLVCSLAWPS